jgi:hypothetical protein
VPVQTPPVQESPAQQSLVVPQESPLVEQAPLDVHTPPLQVSPEQQSAVELHEPWLPMHWEAPHAPVERQVRPLQH